MSNPWDEQERVHQRFLDRQGAEDELDPFADDDLPRAESVDFFRAVSIAPPAVMELAVNLREASADEGTAVEDRVVSNATLSREPDQYARDGVRWRLNWFGLARNILVPGCPSWKWQNIIGKVRHAWESVEVAYLPPDFDAECVIAGVSPSDVRAMENQHYDDMRERGERCARVLVSQAAQFITTYLEAEPDITPKEAEELSPRQWEVVALVCNRRMEFADAGEVMGIEANTVKRHFDLAAAALGLTSKELRRRRLAT